MSRTIIDIPAPLLRATDELCALLGVSRAEVVRRALRDFVRHNESTKTDGFGLWAANAAAPAPARTPARRKA